MPVLFVGHGSPMNIVLKNSYTESLVKTATKIPKPKAILVISAHWLTNGTFVTCVKKPRTIHDFYGFPDELYNISYPSPGSQENAQLATKTVKSTHVKCGNWGLDHAAWAILRHMYPAADVPVFEMSLDYSPFNDWNPKSLEFHYKLGSELAPLREKGVLIIGSGNIVHNLGLIDFDIDAKPFEWAVNFDEKAKQCLVSGNHKGLINYLELGKEAHYAVPTQDHYLPMIYAIGLQTKGEALKFIHEGFQNGSVSMRAFQIG
ncbi:MAG TPA: 4,5-DOPA dioxygenase extradiol [Verrucomicrobiae bacterium]|nr:4,5-DOPA dioxygenase extradiol [Verrucomicrobiae bacterium]